VQDLGRAPLVLGVDEGVQVADRHAFDPVLVQQRQRRRHAGLVQRDQHPAVAVQPLAHRQPQVARHQRARPVDHDVVLLEAVLVRHFQRVAVACRGQQGGAGAAALDQRVGRQRGAVDDQADSGGLQAGLAQHRADAVEHGLSGVVVGGQQLGGGARAARQFQDHVGEGAADVDCQARPAVRPRGVRPVFGCGCVHAGLAFPLNP
jgi:hypothetical protein